MLYWPIWKERNTASRSPRERSAGPLAPRFWRRPHFARRYVQEGMFSLEYRQGGHSLGRHGQACSRHPCSSTTSEIVASRQWDERRLAYPITGHKKGTYLLTYFRDRGWGNLDEIVADCRLSDVILRELVLEVDPKLADHLVNQAMTSTPNVDAEGRASEREEMDDRPRRRRRDD